MPTQLSAYSWPNLPDPRGLQINSSLQAHFAAPFTFVADAEQSLESGGLYDQVRLSSHKDNFTLKGVLAFCSFAAFGSPAARRQQQRVRARRYLRSPKLPGVPKRSLHSGSAMKVCAELCAQRHTAATSASLRAASRCISVYENPGISRSATSLQVSPRSCCCCFAPYVLHSEKFRAFRPRFTSDTTSHDAGATWLYHGQTVRLE